MASNRKVADGGTGQSAGPTERLDAVLFGGSIAPGVVAIKTAAAGRNRVRGAPVDAPVAHRAAAVAWLYKAVLRAAEIVGRANTRTLALLRDDGVVVGACTIHVPTDTTGTPRGRVHLLALAAVNGDGARWRHAAALVDAARTVARELGCAAHRTATRSSAALPGTAEFRMRPRRAVVGSRSTNVAIRRRPRAQA